jgi:conjugal transfer pilus assembly protein TraL
MDSTENYLLNRLDQPLRFLGVNKDEALAMIVPSIAGMYMGWILTGISSGITMLVLLRSLKKQNDGATLLHAVYWYLPEGGRSMKLPVPSHIREYIG